MNDSNFHHTSIVFEPVVFNFIFQFFLWIKSYSAIGGSRGNAFPGPIFLYFHTVFWNNCSNIGLALIPQRNLGCATAL